MRTSISLIGIALLITSTGTSAVFAQRAPAIPGVTGTLVTPETAKQEKKAEDKAGAAIKDALTPDDKGPLTDLAEGTTVVIRQGTTVTEAIVSKRSGDEITVRYANKKTEKMALTDKTAAGARIVEYTPAGSKDKVTRYFRLKS
jgi:hypothetical protein